jgi:hypothetical protein
MSVGMSFKQVSEIRIEIREGGGCLTLFGLPFLAAGIFLLLAGIGIVPLGNDPSLSWWGRPLLFLMGLPFAAVGGWLVFGRTRTIIDTTLGTLSRCRTVLLRMKNEEIPLKNFRAVELGFSPGDSDSPDTFPVLLKGAGSSPDFKMNNGTSYGLSHQLATKIAALLQVPLEDVSSDHKVVLIGDQLGRSLRERLEGREADLEYAAQPVQMRSRVDFIDGGVRIRIPREGVKVTTFLPIAVAVGLLLYLGPDFLEFFERTRTPDPVQWFFIGFALLVFVLFPLLGVISKVIGSLRGYTEITADPKELRLTEQQAWKRSIKTLPAAEIIDLDYGIPKSLNESVMADVKSRMRKAYPGDPAALNPALPGWAKGLMRWVRSKGVTVKHRGGLLNFGAGLPADEVRYLYAVVKRALAGR